MCVSEYFVAGLTVPNQVRSLFSFILDAHFLAVVTVVVAAVGIRY
jgi:hypothetical protein